MTEAYALCSAFADARTRGKSTVEIEVGNFRTVEHERKRWHDHTLWMEGAEQSLLVFSGEAYNVEQGITNEFFVNERNEHTSCVGTGVPEDGFSTEGSTDIIEFANFMRFLDQPTPASPTASTVSGRGLFESVGCAVCHTPTMMTGSARVAALRNKAVNLFSDLAVHNMGSGLADGITQGAAGPTDFRTAPLWGVGQRIFFLHDGRTNDLLGAIQAHSSPGSEANTVIQQFNALNPSQKQDILEFLRSL